MIHNHTKMKTFQGGVQMVHLRSRMDYATGLFQTAEYEEAKIIFNRLLKGYVKQAQTENMCFCLSRLACIAYIQGNMTMFHNLFKDYKTLILKTENENLLAEYELLNGLRELSVQRYEQAIQAFLNVIPLADELNLVKLKVAALLSIQNCYLLLDNVNRSLEMSDELWLTYHETITADAGQLLHYMLTRAHTLYALERLEEMNLLITKCEAHPDLHMMPKQYTQTLLARAKYYMAKAAPHTAMATLEQAIELAETQEDINVLSDVYNTSITNCEIRGKIKQALLYAKKQLELQKELVKK